MNKTQKVFLKLKSRYQFLLSDPDLVELLKQHYDKEGCAIIFIFGLLENRIDRNKLINHIQINKDEWLNLFYPLYKNERAIKLFKKLEVNPITPIEQTISAFYCFDDFINNFILFLKKHEINIGIDETELKRLLKYSLGYILYNQIDCKIPYSFDKILKDPDYDTKYIVVLNNTKLFALVKKGITDNCQSNINNLIMLVLGMSKALNDTK